MTETQLLHLLFQRAPNELPDARLFRRNVGRYRSLDGSRVVQIGVEGQADAYALLRGGIIVEIETKANRGRMREGQCRWQDFCRGWGVPHVVLVASKNASPEEIVNEWIEELRSVFVALRRTSK